MLTPISHVDGHGLLCYCLHNCMFNPETIKVLDKKKIAKLQDVIYVSSWAARALLHHVSYATLGWQLDWPVCQFHCVMYIKLHGFFALAILCSFDTIAHLILHVNCLGTVVLLLQTTASVIRLSSLCYVQHKSPDTLMQ